jgi:signal transduction histidine kinase
LQPTVESWSTQQLAEFLAVVSSFPDERSAIQGALDRTAEALEAEVAALVKGNDVEASIGFPAGQADVAAVLSICTGANDVIEIDGVGACEAVSVSLEDSRARQLVVARFGNGGFSQEERDLLRGTARILRLTLQMLRGLEKERALRRRAEREMAKRKRVQEESDRMRSEFFASVSHELRTPLTSIIGYTELLLGGAAEELTPRQSEFIQITERNARRELRLVNDLLFASGGGAGEFSFDRATVDLSVLVAECVESSKPQAEKAGVQLTHDSVPAPPLIGDGDRLAQLLDNLVSNAIKFTPDGGRAEVRVAGYRDHLVLEVWNSGSYIPPEERVRLFDHFYRSQSANDQVVPGVGLGLAIAKAIVDAHNGAIGVRSDPGDGTVFHVELPVDVDTTGLESESPSPVVTSA